jgi:hypothetical protein
MSSNNNRIWLFALGGCGVVAIVMILILAAGFWGIEGLLLSRPHRVVIEEDHASFELGFSPSKDTGPIPPDCFRVSFRDVVESDNLVVKQMLIEARGKRKIEVRQAGAVRSATLEPSRDEEFMRGEITFVADLFLQGENSRRIKYLAQIKGPGVTVGGPSSFPVKAEELSDILSIHFEGIWPLGQEFVIGNLLHEPIMLRVM